MRRTCTGYLFVSPWLLGFSLLIAYPFAASLYWSFCRYDLIRPPQWVGSQHYQRLATELMSGGTFRTAVWNTVYYALLSVPLSVVVGISLATMLSWRIRGQPLYRILFYLPSVVPIVAASVLWMWLLDPLSGPVNAGMRLLQLPEPLWFRGPNEAFAPPGFFDFGSKDALVLMSVWGAGNFIILYLAALGDIPHSLYEAAEIDGASRWLRFRKITLPLLSPMIFFNVVMGLIQSVQAFAQIYLVSEGTGEPAGYSLVLSLHLFLAAFRDLEMGYASAVAWLLFVLLVVSTAALFRSARHWVFYQGAEP